MSKAQKRRIVHVAVANRMQELHPLKIKEMKQERAIRTCLFLETAASVTEYHSERECSTLSFNVLGYRLLLKNRAQAIESECHILKEVAALMQSKLVEYEPLVCGEIAELNRIMDY